MAEEQYRDLLRRVQQKAESYREQQQQAAALQQQQAAAQAQADPRFARPQMPVPPQPQAPENNGDFWNNFGALTDKDPANAWRYLNQAQQTPDIFRNKMLVME